MAVKALARDGQLIEQGRITKILAFRGLERQPVEEAEAGDIVAHRGLRPRPPSPTRSASLAVETAAAGPADRPARPSP